MPELPEVEFGRRQLEATLVGERIEGVDAVDDPIVFEGTSASEVARVLQGTTVLGAHRRGKHLWLSLDRRPWPLFHFGMTGGFVTRDGGGLQLQTGPTLHGAWPPRFAKLILTTGGTGRQLCMTNARRLGRIRLRNDPCTEAPIAELGFDALLDQLPAQELLARLHRRRAMIKGVLLDQSFAAGVGNWIADEVLHHAGIDPRQRANTLELEDAERLATALAEIVRTAVEAQADAERYPAAWLFHRRWTPGEDVVTVDGARIEFLTVAGRTTVWVPSRQRC